MQHLSAGQWLCRGLSELLARRSVGVVERRAGRRRGPGLEERLGGPGERRLASPGS